MSNIISRDNLLTEETNNVEFDNNYLSFEILIDSFAIDYDKGGLIVIENNLNTEDTIYALIGNKVSIDEVYNQLSILLEDGVNLFYGPLVEHYVNLEKYFTNENARKSLTVSVSWYGFDEIVGFDSKISLEVSPTYPLLLVVKEPEAEEEETGESTEEDESSQNIEKVLRGVREKNQTALTAEATKSLKEIKARDKTVQSSLDLFNGEINSETGYLELTIRGTSTTDPQTGTTTFIENESAFEALKSLLTSSGFEIKNSKNENEFTSTFSRSFKRTYYLQVSNSKTRYKAKLAESSLEALMAFDKICSMLLTEPYLYCKDAKEAKEELNKIQKALSKNVLPVFYQNLEVGIFGQSHVDNLGVPNYTDQVQRGLIDFVNREEVEGGSAVEGAVEVITGIAEMVGGAFLIGSLIGTVFGVATAGLGFKTAVEGVYKIAKGYPDAAHNIERVKKGIKELSSYLGDNKLYYSPDEYVRVAGSLIKVNENPEELSKNLNQLLQQNVKKFGDSKEINNLINVLSNKFYPAFPSFTHFRKLSYDIGTGSKLQELLSERRSTKTEVEEPLNFYSKEISGRGLYDYLYFLLAFPYSFENWDDSEFDEIFSVTNGNSNHYTVDSSIDWLAYNQSRAETTPKSDDVDYDTLLNIQTIEIRKWNQPTKGKLKEGKWHFYQTERISEASVLRDPSLFKNERIDFFYDRNNKVGEDFYKLFFQKNKEQIKADQQKKINYLLAVKAALLEQVIAANAEYFYKTPELRKYVESFSNASIFEIMDDSAYPDIDLPKVDSFFKKTKKMNPAFYYFNPTLNTDIDENKVIKVLKSSNDFKEKVKEGIVTSQPLNLNNRKIDEKELLNKGQIISFSELSLDNLPTNGYPENQAKIVSEGDDESNEISVDQNGIIDPSNASQIKTPRLKIDISSFNDEKELKNYIDSFQSSIETTRKEVEALPKMFGSKNFSKLETSLTEALKVGKPNGDVKNWLENLGKHLQIGKDLDKYSSINSLTDLYKKSYADFFSTKGMQNAFPTFRLYIVEEDAMFSGKLTAYDDFYSYASVIGFDVNIDRELAASTAAIQLQNVSGILDGTKKEVLRDVDVDRREIDSKNDDKYEALVESIVLRPGINVQLRAGYENDTKDLDILISGRISDISHGSDGMTTNIIVQSYGVELEQQIKASTTSDKDKFDKYYTTHQLLGSLMLSPELKHFGRIKVGKIFQTGEDREISIDVKDYSNQSSFTLEYTTSFLSKLSENGHIVALGVAVLPSAFKLGGKLIGKFGFTRSIAGAISRGANLTNQFFGKYSNFVLSTLSQAKYIKFLGKRLGVGMGRSVSTIRKVATEEINAVLTNLKNGVELTPANLATLESIEASLTSATLKSIDDLIGVGTSSAARNETLIMSYILKNEGMTFSGIKNYTFSALGNARTALINENNIRAIELLSKGSGLWNGLKGWSSRAFSYTMNSAGVGLATIGSLSLIPLMIDTINNTWETVKGAASDLYEELFESKKDDTLKIMLSPQDDNLFPPAPNTYLVSKKDRGPWPAISAHIKNFRNEYLNALAFNIPYMVSGFAPGWESLKSEPYAEAKLKELKQLFDTRLVIEDAENEYVLKEQTIFKVFHEMSLRHPGYIYGARPYGRSMEYRMFFGLPNQNYWANDITTVDAIRLNQIIKDLTSNKDKLLSSETCKSLYSGAWESFSKMNERRRFYKSYLLNDSSRANYGRDYADKSQRVKERTDSLITIKEEQIRKIITKHAMDEYLEKTKDRFVPFRKMHSLNSDKNIVSNSVTVSSHDVINTVTVYYHDTFSNNAEGKYSLQMAANTAIKQNNVREKAVTNPRIIGPSNAYRYGIGELLYGARKLYTGSVLVLGNTKINPWDVVILNDNVNRMHGPLEVKSVTHTFNHQTGFLTNVEVNALVASGEDMLTYPAVTNSILAEAREKMYADYSSKIAFESANTDNKIYKKIIRKIVAQKFPRDKYEKELTDELEKFYIQKLDENIKAADANDEPVFLQDIISGNATLPESLKSRIESVSATALTATVGLGLGEAGVALTFGRTPGITNLRSPIGWGFAALTGLFSALYLNSDSALRGIESSLKSGNLGKNLFRPILFSKISNQNLIEVYPIVKDGKPLLTGGFENIPADQTYKNVIGNIFSMVSDGYKGYLEAEAQIDAGGATSVLDWDDEDDFIEVKRGKAFELFGKSENAISKEIYHYGLKE